VETVKSSKSESLGYWGVITNSDLTPYIIGVILIGTWTIIFGDNTAESYLQQTVVCLVIALGVSMWLPRNVISIALLGGKTGATMTRWAFIKYEVMTPKSYGIIDLLSELAALALVAMLYKYLFKPQVHKSSSNNHTLSE